MALVHPQIPSEMKENYPDEYDRLTKAWTRDTKCVHCGDGIGNRMIWHVPLCTDCSNTPIIREQYQRMVR